jgi:hypothetical protein
LAQETAARMNDDDEFPQGQKPTDSGSDVLFDLMYEANVRLWALYVPLVDSDPTALDEMRAIRAEMRAVALEDVAAWEAARIDFDRRAAVLRVELGLDP